MSNDINETIHRKKQIVSLISEIAGVTIPKVKIPLSFALGITAFVELLAQINGTERYMITSS